MTIYDNNKNLLIRINMLILVLHVLGVYIASAAMSRLVVPVLIEGLQNMCYMLSLGARQFVYFMSMWL